MPIRPIRPGVTQIELPWVSAWLLHRGRDAVLVDSGTCRDSARLFSSLAQALPGEFHLHALLLTHAHCDHAGCAAQLAARLGARIGAHAQEAPFIESGRTYAPRGIGAVSARGLIFSVAEIVYPVARRPVDMLLADGEVVETPVGSLRVVHTPGHTPGHVAYWHEREGWLLSGDALLNVIPFLRRTGLSLPPAVFTSDTAAARHSARKIADVGPSALFSGHGPPLTERAAESIRAFVKGPNG